MKYVRLFISLVICAWSLAASAVQPLPVDQAFHLTGTARDNQTILLTWKIAPRYYLYRDRFQIAPLRNEHVTLSPPILPPDALQKTIPGLGTISTYKNQVTIIVPILNSQQKSLTLQIGYQGCSEDGFCYPPTTKVIPINLAGNYMQPVQAINVDLPPAQHLTTPTTDPVFHTLSNKSIITLIFTFLGFGILISLTPCVLPMIPILSSIIAGRGKITHWHSFLLALAYVLGMAITYAIVGLIIGMIGGSVQAIFQQPWIIILFTLLFIAMALSLFGLYNIELPEKLRNKMAILMRHQKRGSYLGVALMGVFSTLILSPCVTAPLVGVLGYISQTGNAYTGLIALFCMGIGMGMPLLLIGAFGPKILPHSGRWMNTMKYILGVLMLGVAIWMLSRILPHYITMILWGLLFVGSAIAMGAFRSITSFWQGVCKTVGILFFIYAILIMVGAIMHNANPWQPAQIFQRQARQHLQFITVKNINAFDHILDNPKYSNKPILLDFYADWCIACQEMEMTTFANPEVKQALAHYVLLRADVTKNSIEDKAMQRHFKVIAPPTILFFNKQHHEIVSRRIVGEVSAKQLLKHLNKIGQHLNPQSP